MASTAVFGPLAKYDLDWLRAALGRLIQGDIPKPHRPWIDRLVTFMNERATASELAALLGKDNPIAEVPCFSERVDLQKLVLTRMLCFRLAQTGRDITHALDLVYKMRDKVGGGALSPKESAVFAVLASEGYRSFLDQLANFSGEELSIALGLNAYAALVDYGPQQQFTKGMAKSLKVGAIVLRILDKIGVAKLPPAKPERQRKASSLNLSLREMMVSGGHHHGAIPLIPNRRP